MRIGSGVLPNDYASHMAHCLLISCGLAGEMIWQVFEHAGVDIRSVTGHFDIDNLVIEFAKSAPFFKHQSFSEEREYRIAAVCLRAGKVPDGEKCPAKQINLRVKDGLII